MNFVISTAIGGSVTNEPNANLRNININMTKSLKSRFETINFDGLDKIKINLYISGDVSEYCDDTGVYNVRYIKNSKEITSEFCITRGYWYNSPEINLERKFLKFMYTSLLDLGLLIDKKLRNNGYSFEIDFFNSVIIDFFELERDIKVL